MDWKISDFESNYLKNNLEEHKLIITGNINPTTFLESKALKETDILIAGNATADMIANATNLKLIQSMISGTSHIAIDSAHKRNIPVCSSKGANANSVGEHALMLILNLAKNYNHYSKDVENKIWNKRYSDSLEGKKLGIIGLGCIGTQIAKLSLAFGMEILSVRMRPYLGTNGLDITEPKSPKFIEKVVRESDYLVITVPKTKATYNLINDNLIGKMKQDARIINLSRGITVDQKAVYNALLKKQLGGFATDVFSSEPCKFEDPIYNFRNVVATPHVAAFNKKAKIRCLEKTIANINMFVKNKSLMGVVDYELGY
ncbi:MAG: hypothetical protein KC589_09675 [Nanoarchaeota archaeon]|nr:hypothetical protein [Nanoarchaeota archaeon]